jgi:hypothetical protein
MFNFSKPKRVARLELAYLHGGESVHSAGKVFGSARKKIYRRRQAAVSF